MDTNDNDGRVPEFYLRDANERADRAERKYIAAQVRLDQYVMREAVDQALSPLDPKTVRVDLLRDILQGANLRTDGERAIVDYRDGDRTLVISPQEAIARMQASEANANLFNVEKPREPTAQEKRNAEISSMPMDQYLKQRKRPGFFGPQE